MTTPTTKRLISDATYKVRIRPYEKALHQVRTKLRNCLRALSKDPFYSQLGMDDLYAPKLAWRVKGRDSMNKKIVTDETITDSSVWTRTDLAGIRIICRFLVEVFFVKREIVRRGIGTTVTVEDDPTDNYLEYPKPSGYRSIHLLLHTKLRGTKYPVPVELQIRTELENTWSDIEHPMIYKDDAFRALPEAIQQRIQSEMGGVARHLHLCDSWLSETAIVVTKAIADEEEKKKNAGRMALAPA
jgi:putative GTP pyrophosphokinase